LDSPALARGETTKGLRLTKDDASDPNRNLLGHYLLMFLVMLVVIWVRVRLLDVPLERDEGEYAYMGQLLLKGMPPYLNVYTMKLPGVSVVYAVFMVLFGQTPFGIHLGFLIVNLISAGMVWLLARRLLGTQTAAAATAIYALLSVSQGVLGVFAHATHFVIVFALAGFLLLLRHLDNRRMWLIAASGLCFGLATTMKQHGALLGGFAFLYLLREAIRRGDSAKRLAAECGLFLLGAATPLMAILIWMTQAGVFERFWFWTVEYPRVYVSAQTPIIGLLVLIFQVHKIASLQPLIWLAAVFGYVLLTIQRKREIDHLFIFGFFVSAFLAMCPGFYFREHYFVLILVPLAFLASFCVVESGKIVPERFSPALRDTLPLVLFTTIVCFGLYSERSYLFVLSPDKVSRDTYQKNPFPESRIIAKYIREHTAPDDKIAVLGSEPQIYFYSDRLAVTNHIYMYNLTENNLIAQKLRREFMNDIESKKPLYIP
jgi:hypothetical protein